MSLFKPLIEQFSKFPGIGPKQAERFVYYLLSRPKEELKKISELFLGLSQITACSICQNYSEKNPCAICLDPKRESGQLCLVAKGSDLTAIEKSGQHRGQYFVLGNTINPVKGIGPETLKIKEFIDLIKKKTFSEIILALDYNLEGESTALYLTKTLKEEVPAIANGKIKISRLARGLPSGGELEYADEVTLGEALKNRSVQSFR